MWQHLFGPKTHECLVYPRPDATVVVGRSVVRLGPRPYPVDLGKAVLAALKSGGPRSFEAEPGELCLTCSAEGKGVTVNGMTVEGDPFQLGQRLMELAALPSGDQVAPQPPRAFSSGSWLAAACAPEVLIPTMGLRLVKPCTWEEGMTGSRVFVTPQFGQYTLALGLPQPDPEAEAVSDPVLLFAESLSQRAKRVGYFAVDAPSGLAAWALAEEGTIARAYAYLGEIATTLWRLGLPTSEEGQLPPFFDSSDEEADDPSYWQRSDLSYPEAEHVLQMARAWTLDPSSLQGEPSTGWSGSLNLS